MEKKMPQKQKFLFEISWEICNKIGGIHTVISSKIREIQKTFNDNYCLIGPLFDNNPEFIEDNEIDVMAVNHRLKKSGINARFGRWNTDGRPKVILVPYKDIFNQNKLLYSLWEDFGVDSMNGGWDYVEPVLFSTAAAMVIEAACETFDKYDITAHFHEWMTGAGLLYLKRRQPKISTVFTCHATILGRTMSAAGVDIYKNIESIDSKNEAMRYNVAAKHSLELTAARETDCFTTVSDITALEARSFLGAAPSYLLYNGFNVQNRADNNQVMKKTSEQRSKLLGFAEKFCRRKFDPDKTCIVSSSGRYEYHNKGIDLLMEALGRIKNNPEAAEGKSIVVFLFVSVGLVDTHRQRRDINDIQSYYGVCTHPVTNEHSDPVINFCQTRGITNNPEDRLFIVYMPVYLNGSDGILNMDYYDALSGCDFTIYPSSYEPWGYTPLESLSYSVPTIVSDLSGFGKWLLQKHCT